MVNVLRFPNSITTDNNLISFLEYEICFQFN